jgi:DNA-binding transcriptional LysR family regulator
MPAMAAKTVTTPSPNLRLDRFEAMRVFLAVADARGFAAAARRLRRSPPAITRTIAALEAQLGARLLSRTTRVVRLTEAGERFAADARRILGELEEAEAAAASSHRELRGSLRLTAPRMFGRLHVAPIARELLAAHPALAVRALFADRVVDLVEEGIDCAVRIADLADSSLSAIRVGAVHTVLCAAPRYLQRRAPLRHPRDLEAAAASKHGTAAHEAIAFHAALGEPRWSFVEPSSGSTPRARGARFEITPPARFVVSSTEVGLEAALDGGGVFRSLSYLVAPHLRSGALVRLCAAYEPPPLPVHLVVPEGRRASARVRAFVELATQRLRAALAPGGAAALPELADRGRDERATPKPRRRARPARP